ncbi:MAG: Ser-Thr-rich GPI-anchored membrane family protein, partial [Bacteroidota bacterium]
PNTPTTLGLVRLSNTLATRFWDSSDANFSINVSTIHVNAPNGGEKYEMSQPVTVTWTSQNTTTLRLEYSPDNGATWQRIATGIPAAAGSYTFTPVAIPTKLALVRLFNADRERIFDQSDAPFELMPPKGISVLTPAASDRLVRNSTTAITWDAPRVNRVNIQFSSNGGSTWQTLASNVLASEGSYIWTVPNQLVQQAKIRIVDASDITIYGESGIFSIVDPVVTVPTLKLLAPNGGEKFTEGDPVSIRWASSSIATVTIFFSADSGATWTSLAQIPAGPGLLKWTAPANPGTNYMIKITSGALTDQSDSVFAIVRRLRPALTVLRPNGGEILSIDSTEQIRWSATDITGNVTIEYSTDGKVWHMIATVPSTPSSYAWKVPNDTSSTAMLRITSADGKTIDSSNAVWSISRVILPQIVLLSPNGGEIWATSQTRAITWDAPSVVTSVDLAFSVDGGATWTTVKNGVASAPGAMSYAWTIPGINATTTTALVRVSNSALAGNNDISDQTFTIKVVSGG